MSEHESNDAVDTMLRLSDEVLSLENLQVKIPARMAQFGSIDEFKRRCYNFSRYFDAQNIGDLPEQLVQNRSEFRRCRLLFPFHTYFL